MRDTLNLLIRANSSTNTKSDKNSQKRERKKKICQVSGARRQKVCFHINTAAKDGQGKLDGVGPNDNRPSTD